MKMGNGFQPVLEKVLVAERKEASWNQFNFVWIAQQVSLFQVEQLRTKTLTPDFRLCLAIGVGSLEKAVVHDQSPQYPSFGYHCDGKMKRQPSTDQVDSAAVYVNASTFH